jgi:UDP-N-acetylglucosamine 2-epimerase (non-hydrolysing)
LIAEGIAPAAVHVTGNTGIDALLLMQQRLQGDPALSAAQAARFGMVDWRRPVLLLTVHRRENHGPRLAAVLAAAAELAAEAEIVLPLHPSPAVRGVAEAALAGRSGIHLLPPLDYPAFVWLMGRATLALTDSGGVQEEAPALGLPVLVLRDVTERREGLASGNARLVGTGTATIVGAVRQLLADSAALDQMGEEALPYGAGDASRRIADVLAARYAPRLAAE